MIFNKCFKKFGFCENFICWIQVLLNDQQSCVINGEFTTPYFNLEKGARQGDYISAYLFIPALEVLLLLQNHLLLIFKIYIHNSRR